MIKTTLTYACRKCHSQDSRKNGKDAKSGKQKYHCKQCNSYGIVNPSPRYSQQDKQRALRVYQERASLRGVELALGISRKTLAAWVKKSP